MLNINLNLHPHMNVGCQLIVRYAFFLLNFGLTHETFIYHRIFYH